MQAMAPEEQQAVISETAERRNVLKRQISELTGERSAYLEKKVEEAGGARDSLDDKIYRAVREQAGKLGLTYEADAPAY
jgi:cell division protein FtsB